MKSGILEDRQGNELRRITPAYKIQTPELQKIADEVLNHLKKAINLASILVSGNDNIDRPKICDTLDDEREMIINRLNEVWEVFGIRTLPVPSEKTDSTDVYEEFGPV